MKKIDSPSDLAINGAPPAFTEPLHVGRPNLGSRPRLLNTMSEVYDRRWLTNNGPLVRELESRLSQMLSVKHCIAMCNGTVALEIAARALSLHGEVILPSYTFIATAHALHWQEITPVFADIDPGTHNLDPAAVRRMISEKTTAIVAVNLWGRPAPIRELQMLADEFNLRLIFDSAHAFSCTYNAQMLGSFGDCEILSFHATKFFNTMEGGALTTNDDELAARARLMRNFGFSGYDNVVYPGINGKMTEASAAMGLTNLDSIDYFLRRNQENYAAYCSAIDPIPGLELLAFSPDERANFQYIVVEVDSTFPVTRDELAAILHAENVLARRYFWPGCHRMMPYRELFPDAGLALPHTERISDRVIVLPTGEAMAATQIQIIGSILELVAQSR